MKLLEIIFLAQFIIQNYMCVKPSESINLSLHFSYSNIEIIYWTYSIKVMSSIIKCSQHVWKVWCSAINAIQFNSKQNSHNYYKHILNSKYVKLHQVLFISLVFTRRRNHLPFNLKAIMEVYFLSEYEITGKMILKH